MHSTEDATALKEAGLSPFISSRKRGSIDTKSLLPSL